jgi:hypothetical protein
MEQRNSGGCLCGAVRFETRGPLRKVVACHCSQCRRQTGLFYAATNARLEDVRMSGETAVTWYRASANARRGFCCRCGSALFWQEDGEDRISILAGAFDQPSGLVMGHHIYCDDKADFYEIPEDGLPRYPGNDGD